MFFKFRYLPQEEHLLPFNIIYHRKNTFSCFKNTGFWITPSTKHTIAIGT